jgi:hypothetical protein
MPVGYRSRRSCSLPQGLDEHLLQHFVCIVDLADPMTKIATQLRFAHRPGGQQAGSAHNTLALSEAK